MTYQASSSSFRLGLTIHWSTINKPLYFNKAFRLNIILNIYLKGVLSFLKIQLVKWFINTEALFFKLSIFVIWSTHENQFFKNRWRKRKFGLWQHYYYLRDVFELKMIHNLYVQKTSRSHIWLTNGRIWSKKLFSIFFILANRKLKLIPKTGRLDIEEELHSYQRSLFDVPKRFSLKSKSSKYIAVFPLFFQVYQFSFVFISKLLFLKNFKKSKFDFKKLSYLFFLNSALCFFSKKLFLFKDILFFSFFIRSAFDRNATLFNRLTIPALRYYQPEEALPDLLTFSSKNRWEKKIVRKNFTSFYNKIPWFSKKLNKKFLNFKNKQYLNWSLIFLKGFFRNRNFKRIARKKIKDVFFRPSYDEKFQFLVRAKIVTYDWESLLKNVEGLNFFKKNIKRFVFFNYHRSSSYKLKKINFFNYKFFLKDLSLLYLKFYNRNIKFFSKNLFSIFMPERKNKKVFSFLDGGILYSKINWYYIYIFKVLMNFLYKLKISYFIFYLDKSRASVEKKMLEAFLKAKSRIYAEFIKSKSYNNSSFFNEKSMYFDLFYLQQLFLFSFLKIKFNESFNFILKILEFKNNLYLCYCYTKIVSKIRFFKNYINLKHLRYLKHVRDFNYYDSSCISFGNFSFAKVLENNFKFYFRNMIFFLIKKLKILLSAYSFTNLFRSSRNAFFCKKTLYKFKWFFQKFKFFYTKLNKQEKTVDFIDFSNFQIKIYFLKLNLILKNIKFFILKILYSAFVSFFKIYRYLIKIVSKYFKCYNFFKVFNFSQVNQYLVSFCFKKLDFKNCLNLANLNFLLFNFKSLVKRFKLIFLKQFIFFFEKLQYWRFKKKVLLFSSKSTLLRKNKVKQSWFFLRKNIYAERRCTPFFNNEFLKPLDVVKKVIKYPKKEITTNDINIFFNYHNFSNISTKKSLTVFLKVFMSTCYVKNPKKTRNFFKKVNLKLNKFLEFSKKKSFFNEILFYFFNYVFFSLPKFRPQYKFFKLYISLRKNTKRFTYRSRRTNKACFFSYFRKLIYRLSSPFWRGMSGSIDYRLKRAWKFTVIEKFQKKFRKSRKRNPFISYWSFKKRLRKIKYDQGRMLKSRKFLRTKWKDRLLPFNINFKYFFKSITTKKFDMRAFFFRKYVNSYFKKTFSNLLMNVYSQNRLHSLKKNLFFSQNILGNNRLRRYFSFTKFTNKHLAYSFEKRYLDSDVVQKNYLKKKIKEPDHFVIFSAIKLTYLKFNKQKVNRFKPSRLNNVFLFDKFCRKIVRILPFLQKSKPIRSNLAVKLVLLDILEYLKSIYTKFFKISYTQYFCNLKANFYWLFFKFKYLIKNLTFFNQRNLLFNKNILIAYNLKVRILRIKCFLLFYLIKNPKFKISFALISSLFPVESLNLKRTVYDNNSSLKVKQVKQVKQVKHTQENFLYFILFYSLKKIYSFKKISRFLLQYKNFFFKVLQNNYHNLLTLSWADLNKLKIFKAKTCFIKTNDLRNFSLIFCLLFNKVLLLNLVKKQRLYYYKILEYKYWLREKKLVFWLENELEKNLKSNIKLFLVNAYSASQKYIFSNRNMFFYMSKEVSSQIKYWGWKERRLNTDILWNFLISVNYFSSSFLSEMLSEQIMRRKKHWSFIRRLRNIINVFLGSFYIYKPFHLHGFRISINGKIQGKDRGIKHLFYKSYRVHNNISGILPVSLKVDYSLSQSDSWYGSFGIQVWFSRI